MKRKKKRRRRNKDGQGWKSGIIWNCYIPAAQKRRRTRREGIQGHGNKDWGKAKKMQAKLHVFLTIEINATNIKSNS